MKVNGICQKHRTYSGSETQPVTTFYYVDCCPFCKKGESNMAIAKKTVKKAKKAKAVAKKPALKK
jgi:hypothetical protein